MLQRKIARGRQACAPPAERGLKICLINGMNRTIERLRRLPQGRGSEPSQGLEGGTMKRGHLVLVDLYPPGYACPLNSACGHLRR
jgi:hypothetical protein